MGTKLSLEVLRHAFKVIDQLSDLLSQPLRHIIVIIELELKDFRDCDRFVLFRVDCPISILFSLLLPA